MDTFFAAANNLDHLLDELEENEDEVESPYKSKPIEDMGQNVPVTLLPTIPVPMNTDNVDALNTEIATGGTAESEAVTKIDSTPEKTLPVTGGIDEPPALISLDTPNSPSKDFVMIETAPSEAVQAPNNKLLLDLFGAVPANNYVPILEKPNGPLSPFNPFKVDLDPDLGTDQQASIAAETTNGDDQTDSNQDCASGAVTDTTPAAIAEDLSHSTAKYASVNPPSQQKTKPTCNSQKISHNPFENVSMFNQLGHTLNPNIDLTAGFVSSEHEPVLGIGGKSSNNVQSSDESVEDKVENVQSPTVQNVLESNIAQNHSPQLVNQNTSEIKEETMAVVPQVANDAVGFPKEISVSEEEFERFWNEMEESKMHKEANTRPPGGKAAGVASKIEPSCPDEAQPPIPKVAVKVTHDSTETTTESQPRSSSEEDSEEHSKRIRMDDFGDVAHAQDTSMRASASTMENASTDLTDMEEDEGMDIPDEMLVTQQEFERFLSEEGGAATILSGADVAMETTTTTQQQVDDSAPTQSVDTTATEEPDTGTTEDSVPIRHVSVPVNSGPFVERPGRLDWHERPSTEDDANAPFPETPPPPYTDRMHETYEYARHASPQHSQRPDSEEAASSSVNGSDDMHAGAVVPSPALLAEAAEDDGFSFLPSAVLESIVRPGETKPEWVPDHDAPQCSNCAVKFTFTKRRHHCRACGRVFCAACCSMKSQLKYLDFKEARVCSMCNLAIMQADALAEMAQRTSHARPVAPSTPPGAENMETDQVPPVSSEDGTPELVATTASSTSAAHVVVGQDVSPVSDEAEETEESSARTPGPKSVRFSDGTRPKHPDEMPSTPPPPARMNRLRRKHGHHGHDPSSPDGRQLPPIIIAHGEGGSYAVEENPDMNVVAGLLESGGPNPQSFVLNPNLITHVKIISYANRQCWCFWTEGMDGVGQREVALLLEREGLGDRQLPQDAFMLFGCIFDRARKGKIFNTTDFMPMTMLGVEDGDDIFGHRDNTGILFVQVTSQTLDGLECLKKRNQILDHDERQGGNPLRSMLFAILVQKTEGPWATLFPMRLMLRLGMETKQYPCPLFSARKRQPVYHQLGHTIMAILCDFRNFKYRVVSVPGLRVLATASGSISIQIPCNRFSDTIKIMNSSNESVLAMGTGTFGPKFVSREEPTGAVDAPCDSHLVCVQDKCNSNYHTEVMCMKSAPTVCTGAAFVIFNGSLKSDGNHSAKCAIVEDGIMVQLLPEKMEELRASLRSMDDFTMPLSIAAPATPSTEVLDEPDFSEAAAILPPGADLPSVEIRWVEDDTAFNIGMFSPIDGTAFEGVVGFNVQGRSEQKGRKHTLRWNQVFFLASASDPLDMSRLAEQVANGCFLALTPVLQELAKHRQHKVSVRVTIHPENVGYVAGSRCRPLPQACMNALDDNLIPTIHNAAANVPAEQEAVIIELLFSILLLRPGYRTA